jgi:hypothetical protein
MTLTWTANELLTGKKFTDKKLIVAFKNGKQSFSGTVSDQFDADLKLTLPQTSAKYVVGVNYGTSGDPAADITLAWDVTGGATVTRTAQALETAGLSTADALIMCRELSTAGWSAGTVTGIASAVREKLIVSTGGEPCTLTLVWHQNVSNATPTTVHDYGWAEARRLT